MRGILFACALALTSSALARDADRLEDIADADTGEALGSEEATETGDDDERADVDAAPDDPPLVELAPPADEPPPEAEPMQEPPPLPAQPEAGEPHGLGAVTTGLVTFGTGAAIGLAVGALFITFDILTVTVVPALAALLLPVSCLSCLWGCVFHPVGVGALTALIGDRLGNMRGAFAWSLLGALGGCAVGGIIQIVVGTAVAILVSASALSEILNGNPAPVVDVRATDPAILSSNIGLTVVSALLTAGGATAGYLFFAEEKKVGDDGSGLPGVFSPNHPAPKGAVEAKAPPRSRAALVMAY